MYIGSGQTTYRCYALSFNQQSAFPYTVKLLRLFFHQLMTLCLHHSKKEFYSAWILCSGYLEIEKLIKFIVLCNTINFL